jgi:hypothetical protein
MGHNSHAQISNLALQFQGAEMEREQQRLATTGFP